MALRGAWVPLWTAARIGAMFASRGERPFDLGRAMQRLWLTANAESGLALHAFGILPMCLLRIDELNGQGLTEWQNQRLSALGDRLFHLAGIERKEARLIMVFRIGYANPPRSLSRRRAVESFLLRA
jgi:hypothetical protein